MIFGINLSILLILSARSVLYFAELLQKNQWVIMHVVFYEIRMYTKVRENHSFSAIHIGYFCYDSA